MCIILHTEFRFQTVYAIINADTYAWLNFKNIEIWPKVFPFSLMCTVRSNKAKMQKNLELKNANP